MNGQAHVGGNPNIEFHEEPVRLVDGPMQAIFYGDQSGFYMATRYFFERLAKSKAGHNLYIGTVRLHSGFVVE
jgi:hypothetical protein